ncbi:hypothetical protein [Tsukamurella hominis]|uniref:hypothetical protein n=1 Tax=Tsukamurella hominis TaxID=1970232 RepID=UPI0039E8A2AE
MSEISSSRPVVGVDLDTGERVDFDLSSLPVVQVGDQLDRYEQILALPAGAVITWADNYGSTQAGVVDIFEQDGAVFKQINHTSAAYWLRGLSDGEVIYNGVLYRPARLVQLPSAL